MKFVPPCSRLMCGWFLSWWLLMPGTAAQSRAQPDREVQRDERVLTWTAPSVDVRALMAEDAVNRERKDIPSRVGYPFKTRITPENSGTWTDQPGGDRLWELEIHSKNALWIVVGFNWFDLAPGGELYVSDLAKDRVLGPFTSKDVRPHRQLWFPPIDGDGVRIELHWPAALRNVRPALRLGTISHGYRTWNGGGTSDSTVFKSSGDGPSGACNVDVACQPDWDPQARSVVRILSGGFAFCTGALVNNTSNDCVPYVLTASHCDVNPPSTTYQFNYECSLCEGGTVETGHTLTGSTRVARYSVSDVDLLRLDLEIPEEFDAFYAGWNHATNPAIRSTAIHHPQGDVKKISQNLDPLVSGSQSDGGWGGTHWRVTEWEEGTTEPSSSGAPLFDQNGRIVGQLHGGFASCSDVTWDEFGKFDLSWTGGGSSNTRLQDWLDPVSTGTEILDGIEGSQCLVPVPKLEIGQVDVDDSTGNGDAVIDPGESFSLTPRLDNTGALFASDIHATLSSVTPGVILTTASADWPDIASQDFGNPLTPFRVALDPSFVCGQPIEFELDSVSAEGAWNEGFTLGTGVLMGTELALEDDMESGTDGWTTMNLFGSNSWSQTNARSNSPTISWFVNDLPSLSDSVLVLDPLFDLAPGSSLSFRHYMASEAGFDGGVLEYSINGVDWIDAAPLIVGGSYNLFIDTGFNSALAGRQAWSGNLNGWQTVTVDLGSLAREDLRLRWRFASDAFLGVEGWYVDDIRITRGAFECHPVATARPGETSSPIHSDGPLRIDRGVGGYELNWSPPGIGGPVENYVLYGRPLTNSKRISLGCIGDLATETSAVLATLPDNYGFLIVARNSVGEGSYGFTSDGVERATGIPVCP